MDLPMHGIELPMHEMGLPTANAYHGTTNAWDGTKNAWDRTTNAWGGANHSIQCTLRLSNTSPQYIYLLSFDSKIKYVDMQSGLLEACTADNTFEMHDDDSAC